MAPPSRKGGVGLETKEALSAIVLADSFTQKLRPVTLQRPKVLLPLVNTPMLDYTLEWLAINDVEEVHIFVCAHADAVQEHLKARGWLASRKFRVHVVVSTNCLSVGEALRVMDNRDVVKSDFILVAGDVVSNMNLRPALAAHLERRSSDKASIMTMVMRGGLSPSHIRRLGDMPTTVVMDPTSGRLFKFEEREEGGGGAEVDVARRRRRRRFVLDTTLFSERDSVQVRSDMVEASIYICAPEVLMLFSDNFDYQNVRKDFVSGVLSEEELGNKLFVHELRDEYAARVHNLRSYDAVSRDVLARWVYPFCPDTNLSSETEYQFRRGHVYMDSHVQLARQARVSHDSCIGAGSIISDGALVEASVVGANCVVGPGCVLRGAYLLDDVRLEAGVCVEAALLCDRVVVREGAAVRRGAVLSFDVVVGPGHEVPEGARVSLYRQLRAPGHSSDDDVEVPAREATSTDFELAEEDEADDFGQPPPSLVAAAASLAAGSIPETAVGFDTDVVGGLGAGFAWADDKDSARHSLFPSATGHAAGEEGESSDDEVNSAAGEAGTTDAEVAQAVGPMFKREVGETFLRCVKESIAHDNVVIELNGLKIAEDRTFADCARYMLTTMLGLCLPAPTSCRSEYRELYTHSAPEAGSREGLVELLQRASAQVRRWKALLQKFLRSEDDQVEVLLTLEEFCSAEGDYEATGEHGPVFAHIFAQLLKALYDEDILTEEAILQWAAEKSLAEEDEKVFLRKAQPFLSWLQDAEEESAGSGSEASSDGDEEEA
ncbi:hypothetical protein ACKKBG_A22530 [Auxenochlorella protothecoides x Auxenochlorella symbiontica]